MGLESSTVLSFLLSLWRWVTQDREARINRVVDAHKKLVDSHQDSGFSAFRRAGVNGLRNHKEICQAAQRIENDGYKHPFGEHKEKLLSCDSKKRFFDYIAQHKVDLGKVSVDEVLRLSGQTREEDDT